MHCDDKRTLFVLKQGIEETWEELKKIDFDKIEEIATKTGKKLLQSVNLFDVYEGDKLAEGEVSYAISLTLQDPERTLNEKQIEQSVERILNKIAEETGARLRD